MLLTTKLIHARIVQPSQEDAMDVGELMGMLEYFDPDTPVYILDSKDRKIEILDVNDAIDYVAIGIDSAMEES